ncbi:MAG: glycosyltransferase family 39 protein [Vicinamibacterales bacterium]
MQSGHLSRREGIGFGVAMLALLALALVRLETYPAPWFDEGWYLQVPRNLALFGEYATLSTEGFRHDDTVLSVSPTLYVPIALVFKSVGIGLIQARLVAVAYLLAAVAAVYLFARQLYGRTVAAGAAYLLVFHMEADPFTSTLLLGRQVMGEVPALAFALLGCVAWRQGVVRRRPARAAVAGVLFGLATITKLQYALLLPTGLGLVTLLAWRRRQTAELMAAVVAAVVSVATLGAWCLCLWSVLGTEHARELLANVASASGPQVRVISLVAVGHAVKFLATSTFLLTGVPALVYAVMRARGEDHHDPGETLLLSVIVVCLGWFVLRSIGWPRYAYPFLALTNILTARLIVDLGGLATRNGIATARGAAAALLLLALPMGQLPRVAAALLAQPDHSARDLYHWIDDTLPAGARIETWEYEVAFMDTTRQYHLPPVQFVERMIARVNLGVVDALPYDFERFQPGYLVIGRFAKWTALYPPTFLEQQSRKVATFGEYDVYQVIR